MREQIISMTALFFVLLLFGCQNNSKKMIPKNLSKIYFTYYSDEEKLEYIRFLSAEISKGDYKLKLPRGAFYFSLSEEEKALTDFKDVLSIDSSNADACLGMAICYLLEDSTLFNYYINEAIDYNPENGFAYFLRAGSQNKFEDAIEDYNTAIKLDPQNAHYYFWRGEKYDLVDSVSLSRKDFHKAIEFDSTLVMAYSFLGIQAEIEKQFEKALKYYSLRIKFAPEDYMGYESRGNFYYRMELYEKAIADYKNSIKYLKPTKINKEEIYILKKENFYYDIAINYSFINIDSAYHYLELAFEKDSGYVEHAINEGYFEKMRNTERFKNLINKYSQQ